MIQDLVKYFHGPRLWSELVTLYNEFGANKYSKLACQHANGNELRPLRAGMEKELQAYLDASKPDHIREGTNMIQNHDDHFPDVRKMVASGSGDEIQVNLQSNAGTTKAELSARHKLLWKRANILHAQLKVMVSDKQRAACVAELGQVWEEIDITWYSLDFIDTHGHAPDTSFLDTLNGLSSKMLMQRRNNLRSRLSKHRAKKRDIKDEKSAEFQWFKEVELSFTSMIDLMNLLITTRS